MTYDVIDYSMLTYDISLISDDALYNMSRTIDPESKPAKQGTKRTSLLTAIPISSGSSEIVFDIDKMLVRFPVCKCCLTFGNVCF